TSSRTRHTGRGATSSSGTSADEAGGLVLDSFTGPGDGLETFLRDGLSGDLADPVGAVLQALKGGFDLGDRLLRLRGEHQVALALDGQRVTLAGFVVELGVAGLPVGGQGL